MNEQRQAMSDGSAVKGVATEVRATEERITRALEHQPLVCVPDGFAAKVRAALPTRRAVPARRSVANIAAFTGAVVLMLALCWIAPHARPSVESLAFDLEMLLMAELVGIAVWLARHTYGA
jgi:hypothetical protein